jgi:hypothetical protein
VDLACAGTVVYHAGYHSEETSAAPALTGSSPPASGTSYTAMPASGPPKAPRPEDATRPGQRLAAAHSEGRALYKRLAPTSKDCTPEIHADGIFNADGMMFSLAGWRVVVDEGETS